MAVPAGASQEHILPAPDAVQNCGVVLGVQTSHVSWVFHKSHSSFCGELMSCKTWPLYFLKLPFRLQIPKMITVAPDAPPPTPAPIPYLVLGDSVSLCNGPGWS